MIALAWLAFLAGTTAYAWWKRPRVSSVAAERDLVVLRPCAGNEPLLERSLASFVDPRVRFLIAHEDDAARAIAERHGAVVITRARGPNYKVDQLRVALEHEDAEIVIVADSDVEIEEASIAELVSALEDADVAWAPPIEIASRTWADRASSAILETSLHAFVVLSMLDTRGMVGKLFAIRRSALDRIGGFAAFVNVLGEDVAMAERLYEEGFRVRAIARPARSLACDRTFGKVVDRWSRWLLVVRAQRPWLFLSYPLLFLAPWWLAIVHPYPAIALRVLMAIVARVKAGRSMRGLAIDIVLADALLFVAFARALVSRTIAWRGTRLRVGARGLIEEEARDAR